MGLLSHRPRKMHMPRSSRIWSVVFATTALLISLPSFVGAAPEKRASDKPSGRKLAPGVEQTIPIEREKEETFAVHDVVELTVGVRELKWTPNLENEESSTLFEKSTGTLFRRGIWHLQFTFKPLRLIRVDLPQPNGKMKSELVWYMVYRIIDPGGHLNPVQGKAETREAQFHPGDFEVTTADTYDEMLANVGPHYFTPTFLLRTHQNDKLVVDDYTVEHLDKVLPAARRAIYLRERPNCAFKDFYDTVMMASQPVPVSSGRDETSRYGVVTWIDVDRPLGPDGKLDTNKRRDLDYFTVQLMGLTNAYRWTDPPGAFKPGDAHGTGRMFDYKTLELTFYRPGDKFDAREREIRWGVPGHHRYRWLYRPAITTYKPHRPRQ